MPTASDPESMEQDCFQMDYDNKLGEQLDIEKQRDFDPDLATQLEKEKPGSR